MVVAAGTGARSVVTRYQGENLPGIPLIIVSGLFFFCESEFVCICERLCMLPTGCMRVPECECMNADMAQSNTKFCYA